MAVVGLHVFEFFIASDDFHLAGERVNGNGPMELGSVGEMHDGFFNAAFGEKMDVKTAGGVFFFLRLKQKLRH